MLRVAAGLQRMVALGLIALSCPFAAAAQESVAPATSITETAAADAPDTLRPGQYRWYPETAPAAGPVAIVVSLPLQRAWVFRGGALIGVSTISSGQPGYDTPTGNFRVLEKDVDHHSNRYENAPMPYMQRLTWDGVALHAGHVAAAPASHGCVRLPAGFARRLYAITGLGTRVAILADAPSSAEEALTYAAAE